MRWGGLKLNRVKLLLDNLPAELQSQRQSLAQCLEAMDHVLPLRAVYLFGSYARGEARPESDVDLCIVADGAAVAAGDAPGVAASRIHFIAHLAGAAGGKTGEPGPFFSNGF